MVDLGGRACHSRHYPWLRYHATLLKLAAGKKTRPFQFKKIDTSSKYEEVEVGRGGEQGNTSIFSYFRHVSRSLAIVLVRNANAAIFRNAVEMSLTPYHSEKAFQKRNEGGVDHR